MLATAEDSELDRGATSVGAGAERFCALTRALLPVSDMIRFVVGPAGEARIRWLRAEELRRLALVGRPGRQEVAQPQHRVQEACPRLLHAGALSLFGLGMPEFAALSRAQAGATSTLPGFGKAELMSGATHARLGAVLGSPAPWA